jgi:hypothetical protein
MGLANLHLVTQLVDYDAVMLSRKNVHGTTLAETLFSFYFSRTTRLKLQQACYGLHLPTLPTLPTMALPPGSRRAHMVGIPPL